MEQSYIDVVSKCNRVNKFEFNNEESDKYIPVSKLEDWTENLIAELSPSVIKMVDVMLRALENAGNTTCVELNTMHETMKEKDFIIINETLNILKQIGNKKSEAKITHDYDMLTTLDDIRIRKTSQIYEIIDIYTVDEDVQEELNAVQDKLNAICENKRPSIICKIANRNKKLEIISNRKKLKGKGNPLP